jgi:hypothetical protein
MVSVQGELPIKFGKSGNGKTGFLEPEGISVDVLA